jgi:hypothetical protein
MITMILSRATVVTSMWRGSRLSSRLCRGRVCWLRRGCRDGSGVAWRGVVWGLWCVGGAA